MKWYLIKKPNGAFQKVGANRKPDVKGEVVFEHEDLRLVCEELMRLEEERFNAEEGWSESV